MLKGISGLWWRNAHELAGRVIGAEISTCRRTINLSLRSGEQPGERHESTRAADTVRHP